jgi:hypothetical protein
LKPSFEFANLLHRLVQTDAKINRDATQLRFPGILCVGNESFFLSESIRLTLLWTLGCRTRELELFLRRHVGPEGSTLTKTLDQHLEPLLQLLDPEEAQGLREKIDSGLQKYPQGPARQESRNKPLAANNEELLHSAGQL